MTLKHVLWYAGDRSSQKNPKPQKTKRTIGKVTKVCLTLKKHLHSVQSVQIFDFAKHSQEKVM